MTSTLFSTAAALQTAWSEKLTAVQMAWRQELTADHQAATQLEHLSNDCLAAIMHYLPWHDVCRNVPLTSTRLNKAAAASCSKDQLRVVLQQDDRKMHIKHSFLHSKARRLRSMHLSWMASQHQEQLQQVLQALTVPAAAQPSMQLERLVLHVQLDAAGEVSRQLAALLAGTLQLRHLHLRPVYDDTAICSSSCDTSLIQPPFVELLDTPTLSGLSALSFNGLPPELALLVANHSTLRQLASLELRGVRWPKLGEQLGNAPAAAAGASADQLLAAVGSSMRGLQQLNLSHTNNMNASPAAFAQLAAALPELTALNLSFCEHLWAAASKHESALLGFTQLRKIDVTCTQISLLQLKELAQLTGLTHLACNGNYAMLAGGGTLSHLTTLQHLCELQLSACRLRRSHAAAAALAQLSSLTRLDLSCNFFGLETLAALGSCTSLADLNLSLPQPGCVPRDDAASPAWQQVREPCSGHEAAAALAQLVSLTRLDLSCNLLELETLAAIGSCTSLADLNLSMVQTGCVSFDDDSASAVWQQVRVHEQQPGAAAAAWSQLSSFSQLTSLNVWHCGDYRDFTAGFLQPLAEACGSRLRELLLDAAVKQPGELAVLLPACTGLTGLDCSFSSCRFTNGDLAALAGLNQLLWLRLQMCKPMLRDDVVPSLVQLRGLRQLDLQDNDLTVAGARALLAGLAGPGGHLAELLWAVTLMLVAMQRLS